MAVTKTRTGRKPETAAEKEAREAVRAEKLAVLHASLAEGVEKLVDSGEWKRMLATAGRFHRYSWRNCMLILRQMPGATQVASYRTWQSMGRQVRKGETGLAILAPLTFKVDDEKAPEGEKGQRAVRGFRVEAVFDISQTDGEPLPDVHPTLVEGQAPAGLWDALAEQVAAAGFTLTREDTGDAHTLGVTIYADKAVKVRPELSDAAAASTLAHELAHIMLGHQGGACGNPKSQREVEAESVAYVVCQSTGLDIACQSFAYVAGWASDGKAVEEVTATADRVMTAAKGIIGGFPEGLVA